MQSDKTFTVILTGNNNIDSGAFNLAYEGSIDLILYFAAMYENKKQGLAPAKVYYRRLWKNFFFGMFIMFSSLTIGIIGYKATVPEFDWYDSLLNASMILSGMGPVINANIVLTKTAKVFASGYALFSGVTFISTIGILLAPIAHRFFHKLHLEDSDQ